MTHTSIATEVAVFKLVRSQIAEAFGLDEGDEAVRDSADGETNLTDYLASLMREARVAEAQAKGIAELQKSMADRKSRLEAKGSRIRGIVLHAMSEVDLPKLVAPDFTASRGRSAPAVVVPEPTAVPDEFCRVIREPNKAAIKEALKAGKTFPFAYLSNGGETLVVRAS